MYRILLLHLLILAGCVTNPYDTRFYIDTEAHSAVVRVGRDCADEAGCVALVKQTDPLVRSITILPPYGVQREAQVIMLYPMLPKSN